MQTVESCTEGEEGVSREEGEEEVKSKPVQPQDQQQCLICMVCNIYMTIIIPRGNK